MVTLLNYEKTPALVITESSLLRSQPFSLFLSSSLSLLWCFLCLDLRCPALSKATCSKNPLFTLTFHPISRSEVGELADPSYLKQPISVSLCKGLFGHVSHPTEALLGQSVSISAGRSPQFLWSMWLMVMMESLLHTNTQTHIGRRIRDMKRTKQLGSLCSHDLDPKTINKKLNFSSMQKTELIRHKQPVHISWTHCLLHLRMRCVHFLWDNTGHPCWFLSTWVPGQCVLKLQSNSGCQEHTHAHTVLCVRMTTVTSQWRQRQLTQTERQTGKQAADKRTECFWTNIFVTLGVYKLY